ncbi:MAG: hypothetical protein ACRDOK_21590, partial [Streptosporangiaceae bacterium]
VLYSSIQAATRTRARALVAKCSTERRDVARSYPVGAQVAATRSTSSSTTLTTRSPGDRVAPPSGVTSTSPSTGAARSLR